MTREEAINEIKSWAIPSERGREVLETLIPELRESEDERIRKWIIDFAKGQIDGFSLVDNEECNKIASQWRKAIAYLEKQKNLISYYEDKLDRCACENLDKGIKAVLNHPEEYGLEKQEEQKLAGKPSMLKTLKEHLANTPREQLDAEFEALKDLTIDKPTEWSEDIIQKAVKEVGLTQHQIDWFKTNVFPPKQEWSEENFPKDIERDATQFCFDKGFNITPHQAKEIATHYLMIGHNNGYAEGRKDAHIPAKELGLPSSMDFKQEWSEEDEKMRNQLIYDIEYHKKEDLISAKQNKATKALYNGIEKCYDEKIDWLKSLRPQSKKELSIEKAIQWLDDNFYFLDNSSGRGRDCEITTHDFDSLEEMYDSFRKAVTVDSEPHWKPSEEQLEALKKALHINPANGKLHELKENEVCILQSLLRELEKL